MVAWIGGLALTFVALLVLAAEGLVALPRDPMHGRGYLFGLVLVWGVVALLGASVCHAIERRRLERARVRTGTSPPPLTADSDDQVAAAGEHSDEWPARPWQLTAPESYVLLHGPLADSLEAFKLALQELMAKGALVVGPIDTFGGLGRRKQKSALTEGPRSASVSEAPLASVLAFYRGAPRVTSVMDTYRRNGNPEGVLIEDLAGSLRHYNYRDRDVLPSLAQRGLFELCDDTVLGIFSSKHHLWTPAGVGAQRDLKEWIEVGNARMSDWASNDPPQARAFADGAGAAVLLMKNLQPEFDQLRRHADRDALSARGTDRRDHLAGARQVEEGPNADVNDAGLSGRHGPGDPGGDGFSGLEIDIAAFDGLADFDAIDAGIDAGASAAFAEGGGCGGGGGG